MMDRKNWRKNLGRVISPFLDLERGLEKSQMELKAYYAPGGCYRDVYRGHEMDKARQWEKTFAEWGVRSQEELEREILRRIESPLLTQEIVGAFWVDYSVRYPATKEEDYAL